MCSSLMQFDITLQVAALRARQESGGSAGGLQATPADVVVNFRGSLIEQAIFGPFSVVIL